MNSSGHLPMSESALRRVQKANSGRKKKAVRAAKTTTAVEPERAAAGTLTRTKSLLLAALRVWELKQRISE
jgi:hypothetical protein